MLLLGLLAVAVFAIQGAVASSVYLDTVTKSVTSRVRATAATVADSGYSEALTRLRGLPGTAGFIGDPLATLNLANPTPNPLWTAYLLTSSTWQFTNDPQYNVLHTNYVPTNLSLSATGITANALQTTLPYWAKIRHKTEYDAELAGHRTTSQHYTDGDGVTTLHTAALPGNVIYYGYLTSSATKPVQFTTTGTTRASPVELVTIYGRDGNYTKAVVAEMARQTGPPLYAPLYSDGNINFARPGYISGTDACGIGPNRPPVYIQSPKTISGSNSYGGTPATPVSGTLDVNRSQTINSMKAGATVITTDKDGATFGTSTNYVTVYSNTSSPTNVNGLQLKNTVGYGTLLVDGDLILGRDVTWNGLIIATGLVTLKAPDDDDAATLNVRGAILSDGVYAGKSGYDVRYDSCQLAKAMAARPLKLIRWRS